MRGAPILLLLCLLHVSCSSAARESDGEPDASVGVDGAVSDVDPTDTSETSDADAGQAGDVDTGGTDSDAGEAPVYGLSDEPYTTLQGMWAPRPLSSEAEDAFADDKTTVTDIDRYEEYGVGVEWVEGQPWVEHDELAPDFGGQNGDQRRSLLYFWESADPQLIDEESPIRFEGTIVAPIGSTYPPQSHLTAQVYESQVRTARRISEQSGRPFDFAFIAGDLTDGGQQNELAWAIDVLTGGVVHPDSGLIDDPVPGPGNDFTDPFYSRGIGVPWYPAIGNHETLYMGVLPASDSIHRTADFAPLSIVQGKELRDLLASFDNVMLHVSGHGHKNTKKLVQPEPDDHPERGHWEIMCSSTVDFPMQSRIIELVWEGDEHLSVYVTNVEQNAADETMAREALDLAAGRRLFVYDDYRQTWEAEREKMNLLLRFELPDAVVDNLEREQWDRRIESEETLLEFTGPDRR